jgi:asparagine synthase (glutamine-hydrolysing)
MCGIAGILSFEDEDKANENDLVKMMSTLVHRGPDGWGTFLDRNIALGHTRLSIVDPAGGHQPMTTDRYAIIFNGEIYNHIELRSELGAKGVRFRTSCDTEVALMAYDYYGTEAFKKFNGQFALIIWDMLEHKAIIARDRFAIRPLYVLKNGPSFYFASEMKAFDTLQGWQRSINVQHLFEHALLWNTLGDDTIYNDIWSLPGGTYEIYRQGRAPERQRYYEIGETCGTSHVNIGTAVEEFADLLNDSVKLRLRSDVPVGAYLSGGIDSSVITHLTRQNQPDKFKTFSVGFEDSEYDESSYQREMVDSIQSDHHSLSVDYRQINDNFLEAVYHFERPVFRSAGVPLFMLSDKVRSSGIKVVLTGEGADELLFGYDSFKELKLLQFWSRYPESKSRPLLIRKLYPHLQHFSDPKRFGLMKMYYEDFLDGFDNELTGLNIRAANNKILLNYLGKDHDLSFDKERLLEKIRGQLPDNFSSWTLLQQNQFMEMKTLLSGYLLSSQGDRMSMAHSVEGRYPFLDHRVVEMLFYCRDQFKLSGFSQKYLLAEAFGGSIPSSIVKRPKQPYMAPDLKSFFHGGSLSDQAAQFLSEDRIRDEGIFDTKMVGRLIKKFNRRVPENIGYRDNMLITFILSCQMAMHWSRNPRIIELPRDKRTVHINHTSKRS